MFSRFIRRRSAKAVQRSRCRPGLEVLEDRTLPSSATALPISNPTTNTAQANALAGQTTPQATQNEAGYWLVSADGSVYVLGDAEQFGSPANLSGTVVGLAGTPTGHGYWLATANGSVYGLGDAHAEGDANGDHLTSPIVGMAADALTGGYYLVTSHGGVFAFHAPYRGGAPGQAVTGIAASPSGSGYWLALANGGVEAEGAKYYGSAAGYHLDSKIAGIAATPDGKGYWLATANGSVFAFGDARFRGDLTLRPPSPIVGIAAAPGGGYLLAAASGQVYSFGTPFEGQLPSTPGAKIVGIVATAPLAITSAANATFVVGQAGSFTVKTSGFPVAAFTPLPAGLPAGLTFTDNGDGTATISGTPDAGTASPSPYAFTITAANTMTGAQNTVSVTQTFDLTVEQAPAITSAANAMFTVGTAGSFAVTTMAGVPAATTLTEHGKLPAGVRFIIGGNGTATLAGRPVHGSGGTYVFTITAANTQTLKTTQTFTLTVDQPPAIISAHAATVAVGRAYSFTVKTSGFPKAAFTPLPSGLPAGLTFTDNVNGTATIAGTPNAGTASLTPYTFTITASNTVMIDDVPTPETALQTFSLTVDQPPAITSANNAAFTVGEAGTFTVTTSPGLPAATKLTEKGKLPAGVTFIDNANGTATLAGTPATAGTFIFTITAANAAVSKTTQTFTLTVHKATTKTTLRLSQTSVTLGAEMHLVFTVQVEPQQVQPQSTGVPT